MKPSCVVSLLILSLLLTKAHAIRLGKGSLIVEQQKHDEENTLLKRSNTDAEEASLCKDEQCTGNIKNRKLVTTSISTSKSLSKNVKNREDVAHVNVNGEAKDVKEKTLNTSKHSDLLPEDFAEINEIDYSPARRKTPIHN